MITGMIFLYLILSSGSVVAAVFTKYRYECVLPITAMGCVLLLYLFYFLNMLPLGFWFVVAICAACYILAILAALKKKNLREAASRLVTPGFVVFLIIYCFLFFRLQNWIVMFWDELRLWAAAPKLLFFTNTWLSGDTMLYPGMQQYPIAMPLFQYLLLRLSNGFREGYLFIAYAVFSLTFLMPALKNIRWRQFWLVPILAFAIIVLPMTFFNSNNDYGNFYTNLFIDATLGMAFGYAIALPMLEGGGMTLLGFAGGALALATLPLLKDSGYLLAIFAAIVLTANQMISRNLKKERAATHPIGGRRAAARVIALAALFIIPTVTKFGWALFIGQFHLTNSYVSVAQGALSSSVFDIHNPVFMKFASAVVRTPIVTHTAAPPFRWSFGMIGILFCVSFFILAQAVPRQERKRLVILAVIVLGFSVVYVAGLYLLYATGVFGEIKSTLPSYQRYVSTYLLGVEVFIFASMFHYLSIEEHEEDKKAARRIRVSVLAVAAVFLAVTPLGSFAGLNYLFGNQTSELGTDPYADRAAVKGAVDTIKAGVNADTGRQDVYLVIQGNQLDNSLYHHLIYFELLDDRIFVRNTHVETNVTAPASSPAETKQTALTAWESKLETFDYVFLYKVNKAFIDQCASLFMNGPADIAEDRLYRVVKTDGRIALEPVG